MIYPLKKKPTLWVVSGINGSGKSTLVERFNNQSNIESLPLVNPDNLATMIKHDHQGDLDILIKAGKQAIIMRDDFLKKKQSFIIETTLSGKNELKFIEKAKLNGFKIKLVYISVRNIVTSRSRVSDRIKKGGHAVPVTDQIRRFDRSFNNLKKAMDLSDRILIFDNSTTKHRLLLVIDNNKIKFLSKDLPNWFLDKVSPHIQDNIKSIELSR